MGDQDLLNPLISAFLVPEMKAVRRNVSPLCSCGQNFDQNMELQKE